MESDNLNTASFYFNATSFLRSIFNSFASLLSELPLQQLIRLAWIIGGYILLRPYLELGFRKLFATQENDTDGSVATTPQDDDDAGVSSTSATSWGSAARNRTRIRQVWEEEQAREAEEHDFDGIDPDLLEE